MSRASLSALDVRPGLVIASALLGAALFASARAEEILGPRDERVAGARISVALPAGIASPWLFGGPRVHGTSDTEGRLPFALPLLPGSRALVDAEGYAPRLLALDGASLPMTIRLEREKRSPERSLAMAPSRLARGAPAPPGSRSRRRRKSPSPPGAAARSTSAARGESRRSLGPSWSSASRSPATCRSWRPSSHREPS